MVTLGGMVVNHVENHLDARRVQSLDHGLEIFDIAACRIAHVRCEKADRVVTPIVAQSLLHQMPVIDKSVNRHKFNRGDAQAVKVVNSRRRGEPE